MTWPRVTDPTRKLWLIFCWQNAGDYNSPLFASVCIFISKATSQVVVVYFSNFMNDWIRKGAA